MNIGWAGAAHAHQPVLSRSVSGQPRSGRAHPLRAARLTSDAVAVLAALVVASLVDGFGERTAPPWSEVALLGAIAVPSFLVVFARYRLYRSRSVARRLAELRSVVHAAAVATLLTAGLASVADVQTSRAWLATLWFGSIAAVVGGRELVRRVVVRMRSHGHLLQRVVVVGTNVEALAIATTLQANTSLGYSVVGFVDDQPPANRMLAGVPVLGQLTDAPHVLREAGASAAVVATTAVDVSSANALARRLCDAGFHVELSSTLRDVAPDRLSVWPLGPFSMVNVEPPLHHGWRSLAKRSFDILGALALLVVASPVMLAGAVAIRLTSGAPVIFRQRRIGLRGEPFDVLKFRTMVPDAEARLPELIAAVGDHGPLFKMADDPRVTRIGRALRGHSLDELPQLWNVLRGDMSLVGPRPALPAEVSRWTPEAHGRLRVRPGLTGMWQVRKDRGSSFEEYVRLDLYYVDNWSLLVDLALLARTVPVVLLRRNAG